MAIKNKHPYKRAITHNDYLGNSDNIRNSGGIGLLDFRITENHVNCKQESLEKKTLYTSLSDNFLEQETAEYVVPQMWGGIFYFVFCFLLLYFLNRR